MYQAGHGYMYMPLMFQQVRGCFSWTLDCLRSCQKERGTALEAGAGWTEALHGGT